MVTHVWKEVYIKNWSSFESYVKKFRYREWLYRGHSNVIWNLESSYFRILKQTEDIIKDTGIVSTLPRNKHEQEIIASFMAQAHLYLKYLPSKEDKLEWLTIMQHFGTPTRLLDMTFSPYVALYFAVENALSDFCIYAIKHSFFSDIDKKHFSGEKYKTNIFAEQRDLKSFFIAYEPRLKNERVVAQQGAFLISSTNYQTYDQILDFYTNEKKFAYKFIFEKSFRYEALLKLKLMNITSASLFPGLDGFCKSLRFNLLEGIKQTRILS